LSENCWNCHLWHHETYGGVNVSQDELDICKPMERTIDDKSFKPSWCPLVIDECCEYKIEIDIHRFSGPNHYLISRTCSGKFDELVDHWFGSYKHCPNCGKRIKYVEE
jgi:hypothetical protein